MTNEEAIEYLETDISRLGNTRYNIAHKDALQLGIDALRQQRTGHWIESRCDMYVCSECGNTYTDLSGERYGMNCCPNCGAKMTEVTDD